MNMLLIGGLLLFGIFGVGGWFLFSSASKATSILKTLGLGGSAGGIVGVIVGMWSSGWQFLLGCVTGQVGWLGYAFAFFLGLTLVIWCINALSDAAKDRPISAID